MQAFTKIHALNLALNLFERPETKFQIQRFDYYCGAQ